MDGEFDLLGDPVRLTSGRRGRPAHCYTQKNANKVMMLLAMGWSQERIANALHTSVPTLRRYYFSILKTRAIQRDRFDAWQIERAMELSAAGNVGAMRLLDRLVEKNDARLATARMVSSNLPERDEPIGKKEAARRAAERAVDSSNWGEDLKPGITN